MWLKLATKYSTSIIGIPVTASMRESLGIAAPKWDNSELTPDDGWHITLVYLGENADIEDKQDQIKEFMKELESYPALTIKIAGTTMFNASADQAPYVYLVDCQDIIDLRHLILKYLRDLDIDVESEHGFIPHITAAYSKPDQDISDLKFNTKAQTKVEKLGLYWGEDAPTFEVNLTHVVK